MTRILSLLFALLLLSSPAYASGPFLWSASSGGGGSYTGPGDIVTSADGYWGLRAYNQSQANAGAAAIRLCTASDVTCTDIHVTSTGDLSSSDLTTSGCSGIDTCTIKTWYDQSGNGRDETQATIGNRATYKRTCTTNSKPCAVFSGSQSYLTGSAYNVTYPTSMGVWAQRTGAFTTSGIILSDGAGQAPGINFYSTANNMNFGAGTARIVAAADSTWHGFFGSFNGASSILSVDNSQTTPNPGTTAGTYTLHMGDTVTGYITETAVWPAATSGTNITSFYNNQNSYW